MEPIINSILDTDLYKLTMQQAVLELFPEVNVEYRFKNRGKQRFTLEFFFLLKKEIQKMVSLSLSNREYSWLKNNIPFFKPQYLEFLKNYRFNPEEIEISLDKDRDLEISIKGPWRTTILWEVPLMALISELYFKTIDDDWDYWESEIQTNAYNKIKLLTENQCSFADFGTRRRRSFNVQDEVIREFNSFNKDSMKNNFVGTSNVYFAKKYEIKAIGTMAHEFIMGMSILEGLRHSNYYSLQNWVRVYNSDLGIALTDTFGSESFFENFNKRLSKLYDGIRHDSGCPFELIDEAIKHYKKMGIDPLSKSIVFSDGLNVDKAIEIKKYCENKIKCSFGIGTHLTNDFENSPALNMVIKLWSCEGVPVVKLSDTPGKEMGDPDAVKVAKWTFYGEKL